MNRSIDQADFVSIQSPGDSGLVGEKLRRIVRIIILWLTQFCWTAKAPIDNNAAERGLKIVQLHRKNAGYFRNLILGLSYLTFV